MVVAAGGGLVESFKNGERLKRDRQVKRSKSIPNCTILEKFYGMDMKWPIQM